MLRAAERSSPFERGRALWWPHRARPRRAATPAPPRCRARTTSRRSRRPRPTTCASSATCSTRRWADARRRAGVLDRGRHVHAPHEPRARRDDARGRAAGGASSSGFAALLGGPPAPRGRPDRAAARAVPRAASATDGVAANGHDYPLERMKVLLTNDDGIEAEGLQALRRALLERRRTSSSAVIAPDGNRSAIGAHDHDAPAAVGRGGRLRRRHRRLRDRRHAGRLRALRQARADRGLRGRPRRLRHQPRRPTSATTSPTRAPSPPRSRAIVLGLPGDRRLPAVGRRARWTSASGAAFDFDGRRASSPRASSTSSTTCRCPTGTLLNINVPAGEPDGVEVTRLGKRIYRDELKLDAEDEGGRRRYWIYGADPGFHDEAGHRPRRRRRGPHRGHAAALRPHRRRGHRRAGRVRPRAAARARPRAEVE